MATIEETKQIDIRVRAALLECWEDIEKVHAAKEAINRGTQRHFAIHGRQAHCIEGLAVEFEALKRAVRVLSAKAKGKEAPVSNFSALCMDLALMTTEHQLAEYGLKFRTHSSASSSTVSGNSHSISFSRSFLIKCLDLH